MRNLLSPDTQTMSGIKQINIQQQLGASAEGQVSLSSDEPLNDEDKDKQGGSTKEDDKGRHDRARWAWAASVVGC
jgi:hypothetical protein|uniref:Uncharacterized protein n=1 Tax=Oryza sativa subsp. japonica TaxID=39947 RepID=Q6K2I7_ORYSJ|nr:hypothetical protein [Oryza sativa Japonica Group]